MKTQFPAFIACLFFLLGCSPQAKLETKDTHKVINPVAKDTHYSSEYIAEIHSVKFVEVRSKIKGYLENAYVDEGQRVVNGELLFVLSFQDLEKDLQKASAAYKRAVADLQAATVELKSVRLLANKNIVSSSELAVTDAKAAALRAEVEQAKANREHAELILKYSRITAPFTGTVNRLPKKVGSLIAEGDMLTSISDNREVFAYFNLSELDYLKYIDAPENEPKTVSMKLANNAIYDHEGRIEMIESEFDHATGNIALRARFANPDGILKHGSNAKIIITRALPNALFIPQKSTFEVQDKLYVYVVDDKGILQQRNIVAKMRVPDYYIVESGLTTQDRIVYEGVENLHDGDQIAANHVLLADVMKLTAKP